MYQVIRGLADSGNDDAVTIDHTPDFPTAYNTDVGTAYAIGYVTALL